MPITLAGDLITFEYIAGDASGDSWLNPFTKENLAAAIPAIIVTGNIYTFNTLRFIVKGAYTFVNFKSCILEFTGVFASTTLFTISTNGNLMFGLKSDDGAYSEGCIVNTSSANLGRTVFLGTFYDSTLVSIRSGSNGTVAAISAQIVEGSKIIGGGTSTFVNSSAKIKYSIITNCYYGSRQDVLTSFSFDDGFINGADYGLLIRYPGMTFINIIFQSCRRAVRNNAINNLSVDSTLIGCSFDGLIENVISGTTTLETIAILNIKEWLNFVIHDADGLPLENASVKFYNQYNDLVIDELSDINGEIATDSIMRIRYHAIKSPPAFVQINDNKTYSPYKIIISKTGYNDIMIENITVIEAQTLGIVAQFSYPELYVSAVEITDCTQIGADDGQLVITAQGGDGTYEYSLDGVTYQASDTFTDLAPDDYTVYVRDGEGTVATFDVTISEPIPEEYVLTEALLACDVTEDTVECDVTEDTVECELTL